MLLARARNPERLGLQAPGERGALPGLDRAPCPETLRRRCALPAADASAPAPPLPLAGGSPSAPGTEPPPARAGPEPALGPGVPLETRDILNLSMFRSLEPLAAAGGLMAAARQQVCRAGSAAAW